MADENKPAFYPRVGNIKAKNFVSAQPVPFIEDPRAMELPFEYGDVLPTRENLEMDRRLGVRLADLERQKSASTSPLEKLAGGLQAGRFLGSALTQGINSIPTRLVHGDKAADKFIQDRIYKPEQPLAYEYAGDVGNFLEKLETEYKIPPVLPEAVALQFLTGPATAQAARAAGKGAVKAGMALERSMEPVVRGALERGGLPREMVLGMGANTQSNVVKPKGGNWLNRSVEDELEPLKRNTAGSGDPAQTLSKIRERFTPEAIANLPEGAGKEHVLQSINQLEKDIALNSWIDSNLTNYVKKEMATPEDPVRKLAEQGITHFPIAEDPRYWARHGESAREQFGGTQMAQSDLAKQWENRTDPTIRIDQAKDYQSMGDLYPEWIKKLDPETSIYQAQGAGGRMNPSDLGFDHILDVLREDLTAGRIRPEQLNKVSMEQAVRRTFEYDQEMAKRMAETQAKVTEGMPVYKDYPETGNKWIELSSPKELPTGYSTILDDVTGSYKVVDEKGKEAFPRKPNNLGHINVPYFKTPDEAIADALKRDPRLEEALKYEGATMGHCVGGYCDDVRDGNTKIYSLRDAKGEPHVTIEVVPNQHLDYNTWFNKQPEEIQNRIAQRRKEDKNHNVFEGPEYLAAREALPPKIKQIKGKQNAKPKDDYLPFVQDFVRGGNWSEIGDFKNTGLIREGGKIMTPAEHADWLLKELGADTYNELGLGGNIPPAAGMKRGGKVSISNNPDTMMLELGNKRMKEGGSEDDTKPYFGGAGTKKYAAAKKRAEQGDVNTLRDPKTYAVMAGLMGERPDEMGFSVLHPDYQAIKDVAEPAFGLGIAAQAYPVIGPLTKGLPVGASVKNVTPMKASEALGKIEGRPLKITQADRTKVGGGYLGGPGFSGLQLTEPEYRAAEAAWAVQNAGTAKTILGGEGDNAVYAAMLGTPTQHQSNQMVFDKLLGDFKKAAKRGELTPELRDLINMRLAAAVDKKGNPVFPADVDIMDKKFRDIADTFSRRSIAGHLMGGVQVGGKKGQIIDYDKIIRSTTDPALIDQPTGALGNRLFTLSGGIIDRPDLHPAFPTILQGEDLGLTFSPVERNIVMKDFVEKTMREKGRKPGYMDYTRGNPPTQLITEDILTEMQKLGLKKGGAVKKAEGGSISGDDLILEERPL